MLNIIGIFLVFACSFTVVSHGQSIQIERDKIGEFFSSQLVKQKDLSRTLILLDVDETLITHKPGILLGSSGHIDGLTNMLMHQKKYNEKQAIDAIDALLIEVNKRTPIILTDERIPSAIKNLRAKGATVIGFTARGTMLLDTTLRQLATLGIQFSPVSSSTLFLKQGIFTIGQFMTKGEAASRLLKELKDSDFNQIIFLDDKEHNLVSVEKALRSHFKPNQTLYGHVTFMPSGRFDLAKANQELCEFIDEHQNESAFKAFFDANPFTQDFWRDCKNYSVSSSAKY